MFIIYSVGLERQITLLKKDIQERDDVIQDKEKHVYDLKKSNQGNNLI